MVKAGTVAEVQNAVRYAAATGRSVKVSSTRRGGHSATPVLCPSSMGLVLDVAAMNRIAVDAQGLTATLGPGVTIDELGAALHTMAFSRRSFTSR